MDTEQSLMRMRVRVVLLVFVIFACAPGFLRAQTPVSDRDSPQQLRREFQTPPKAYRPMVRWWWPGGDVRDEELRHEIRLLDEANFGGGEIQPFLFGLNPQMSEDARRRVHDYLTPSFFSHVRAALEEAQQRGLWLDYTFGSGWPFGGGYAITPELATVELRYSHQSLRGPQHFHGELRLPQPLTGVAAIASQMSGTPEKLPESWRERMKQRQKVVAVIAVRGQVAEVAPLQVFSLTIPDGLVKRTGMLARDAAVVLTDRITADGTLDWDVPEGEWQIFVFGQFASDLRVLGGIGDEPQLVLDHLKREAFDAHAHRVGDSAHQQIGEFFGNGMRAVFCDSLEVDVDLLWTDNFLAEFRKRRGYDLTPFLPILKTARSADPNRPSEKLPIYDIAGIGDRVRRDYWQTVSDLLIENMYQPFADWAARNHLQSRVQAHGAPADVLRIYGLSSIPETESLFNNGRYDFLQLAASAAHVYGRPIVSSESFVWFNQLYQTTPEKIKRHADELFTAGVNEIIYSGFPYEYMDRPEPGWYPFTPPLPFSSHMNQHNPFWRYLPALNAYITRLQLLSQKGTNVAPVALFRGRLTAEAPPVEPEINRRLMEAGYNFDYINTDALLKSRVDGKQLVPPGDAHYSVLILDNERNIPLELAEKLHELAQLGLPLIFIGATPAEEAGYRNYEQKSDRIQMLVREILAGSVTVHAVGSAADAVAELHTSIPPNLRFASNTTVPFFEKRIGGLRAFFLRNPAAEMKRLQVEFATTSSPEEWNSWTGRIQPLWDFEREGGRVRIRIDVPPYGSTLIVFEPGVKHEPRVMARSAADTKTVHIGDAGWSFSATSFEQEATPRSFAFELPQLVDISQHPALRSFSGTATYTTHFQLDPSWLVKQRHLILSLGEVKDVAEIKLNGHSAGTLLLRPYEADVTGLVHQGENTLEVTVVTTLVNAMAARGPGPSLPGLPLPPPRPMPAGLIGPVTMSSR